MPEYSASDLAKISTLEDMARAGQTLLVGELVKVYWPAPDGTLSYSFAPLDIVPGFTGIVSTVALVNAKLITSRSAPFLELPRTAAISDDSVDLTFSDIDGEISRLCYLHGQGIRVEVYYYFPGAELTLLMFTGTLRAPKDANGVALKLQATAGWRSPNLLLPRRLPAATCQFIHGRQLSSLEEVAEHKGCPYNIHLPGGTIGNLAAPVICPRNSKATCFEQLGTDRFWPGFTPVLDTINNFQTKGPNLPATARGNYSALTDPLRVIAGERFVKGLRVIEFRAENNNNHPDEGFLAALLEIGEGPLDAVTEARINDLLVGYEHLNVRLGELGQTPTGFSPNIGSYSGTAHLFGRVQMNPSGVGAGDISGSCRARGLRDTRVYSDPATFLEQYTTNRAWWLLRVHCEKRWGFGEDYTRWDLQSVIDTADWCDDSVIFQDSLGNYFNSTRSTFNAELNARATQQQISDICVAGRIAVPFDFNGKKVMYPLRRETIDDSIPLLTDIGQDANICVDSNGRPIVSWSYTGDDELVNEYTVTFDDASNGGAETPMIFGDQLQQLRAGRAWGDTTIRVIKKSVPGFGITNAAEAARLGNYLLALGPNDAGGIQNNFKVSLTTFYSQVFRAHPYGLVRVSVRAINQLWDALGIEGFSYFRVMKMKRKPDLKVELELQAYPVDFYDNIEDVGPTIPPPEIEAGIGPHDRPHSVGVVSVTHFDDHMEVELGVV